MSEHVLEQLSAYKDKALAPKDAAQIAAHLESCASCRAVLLDLERASTALRGGPIAQPTKGLENRIVEAILRDDAPVEATKPHFGFRWFFSLRGAAILTTCALAFIILYPNRRDLRMPAPPPEPKLRMRAEPLKDLEKEGQLKAALQTKELDSIKRKDFFKSLPPAEKPFGTTANGTEAKPLAVPKENISRRDTRLASPGLANYEAQRSQQSDKSGGQAVDSREVSKKESIKGGRESKSTNEQVGAKASGSELERNSPMAEKGKSDQKARGVAVVDESHVHAVDANGQPKMFVGRVGATSGISERKTLVINDQKQWAQIWAEHMSNQVPADPLPAVDFSKNQVLVIVAGDRPTSGYSLEIQDIKLGSDGTRVVTYAENRPPKNAVSLMVITQPFVFRVVPRSNGPTIFRPVTD